MEKKEIVISGILFLLGCLLFLGLFKSSVAVAKSDIPIVNDAWYNALQAIKQDSESNPGQPWEKGIITSWWDFGHHFKYFSDRQVTFDGGTQVTPQAHWVGKLLLSSDEDISRNILRMLDCGGNKAFDSLTSAADTPFAINILNKWFKNELKADDVDRAIEYLNCNPTSGYVIASEDMVGKAGVWGHFGSWDFNRADMWINVKKMPKDQAVKYMVAHSYTKDENEAQQLWMQLQTMTESEANNWIAPWPGYAGGNSCVQSNGSLQCGDFTIKGDEITSAKGPPASFVRIKDGQVVETKYNSTFGYAVIFDGQKIIISTTDLANSLFTKMFFLEGKGLKHFKLLTKQQDITGFKIYVYKVEW